MMVHQNIKRFIFYFATIFIVLFFIFIVFISSLKSTVFDVPFIRKYNISLVSPQGWGFFTRNPRENQFALYLIEGKDKKLVTFKNASTSNLLGFSRLSRRINLEFQRILIKVNDTLWVDKEQKSTLKVKRDNHFIYLKKGHYIIERSELTPWQYSRFKNNYVPKQDLIKVELYE